MTERVRAELRRSGGFVGTPLHVRADSATLPPDQATELARLVGALDFTRLGTDVPAMSGADLMRYELDISQGARHWRGTVADPSVPEELRPLLQFLTDVART